MIGVHIIAIAKACTNITVQCSLKAFIGTNYSFRSSFWGESDKKGTRVGMRMCIASERFFFNGIKWAVKWSRNFVDGWLYEKETKGVPLEKEVSMHDKFKWKPVGFRKTDVRNDNRAKIYIQCMHVAITTLENETILALKKEWPCRELTFVKKVKRDVEKKLQWEMRGSKLVGRLANI